MSNARSPRDVCSTTMGTRGLMVLALLPLRGLGSCRRSLATGLKRPLWMFGGDGHSLSGVLDAASRLALVGGPELVAGRRARRIDRRRVLGDEVDRGALGQVFA